MNKTPRWISILLWLFAAFYLANGIEMFFLPSTWFFRLVPGVPETGPFNAHLVAEFLSTHSEVTKVYYPGLASHPQHELAKRQMSGFGGMVSFVLEGPEARALDFAHRLEYFSLAESLGGVESLICHPARMTHGSIPYEDRQRRGVTDGLLRLSVGIEDVDDLIDDLRRAIAATPVSAVTV